MRGLGFRKARAPSNACERRRTASLLTQRGARSSATMSGLKEGSALWVWRHFLEVNLQAFQYLPELRKKYLLNQNRDPIHVLGTQALNTKP